MPTTFALAGAVASLDVDGDGDQDLVIGRKDGTPVLLYLNIGNGTGESGCEVHNPAYDFNDRALPLGAAFFVRAVEARLAAR